MTRAPGVRPAGVALALAFLVLGLASGTSLSLEARIVAALAVAMAVLWITEAIPIAATALLPFLVLPLATGTSASEVAATYGSPILFLVLGGAMVARAVEKTGLHRRVALALAARARATERGVLLAFMVATAAVSMLVSNSATALIMLPVALALAAAREAALGPDEGPTVALILGVAWAATIGGFGTLVGTPTNAIAAGIMNRALGTGIDFLTWLSFGLPLVAVAIPLAAGLLIRLHRVPARRIDPALIAAALGRPGPLATAERRLLPVVLLLLAGWIVLPLLREPLGLPAVDDGMVAIAAGLLLFILPDGAGGRLLERADLARLPWDVLLLFGGGLALAAAVSDSGLAAWAGSRLAPLHALHPIVLAALLVGLLILVTEFASNVATASGFMPVVAAVAAGGDAPVLALGMAAAIASSWGFMMPAGTPPNAIAFASGRLRVAAMARAGALLDLLGIPLIVGLCFLLAR
ncbi:SLC13 family permease [Thermaurantiacus sp.]